LKWMLPFVDTMPASSHSARISFSPMLKAPRFSGSAVL